MPCTTPIFVEKTKLKSKRLPRGSDSFSWVKVAPMSRCAYFVSAPTVRFLLAIERLGLLPAAQRRKIAADVYGEIKPFFASQDVDALRRAAQGAQDERWQLISRDVRAMTDTRFATVVITEKWMLARLELVLGAAPVAEVLAEKRCDVVEKFIGKNLSFGEGEIIPLHPHISLPETDREAASKSAA